jgi:hypothetical protein
VAADLVNLARILRKLGDLAAAQAAAERALAIREAVYSPDHPKVEEARANLTAV